MSTKIVYTVHHYSYLQKLQLLWDKMKEDTLRRLITVLEKVKKHSWLHTIYGTQATEAKSFQQKTRRFPKDGLELGSRKNLN